MVKVGLKSSVGGSADFASSSSVYARDARKVCSLAMGFDRKEE